MTPIQLSDTRMALVRWKDKVKVTLTDDIKGYRITGDDRVNSEVVYPRVSGILGLVNDFERYNPTMERRKISAALSYMSDNINQPDVMNEALDAPYKKLHDAISFGVEAHALLELLYADEYTGIPDKFVPVVNAWYEWIESSGLTIVGTELSMYGNRHHNVQESISFAGTADVLAVDEDDNPVIVDYKTGSSLYMHHALQMAAYSMALKYVSEGHGIFDEDQINHTRAIIVRLPKTEEDSIEIKEVNDFHYHQETFVKICEIKKWMSYRKKWKPRPPGTKSSD